jgi:hypothetical protein
MMMWGAWIKASTLIGFSKQGVAQGNAVFPVYVG